MKLNRIEQEPIPGKRYLVLLKCEKGIHNCLAYNWPYPCCQWNILYYMGSGQWQYSTNEGLKGIKAIAWADLPETPNELMTYESK